MNIPMIRARAAYQVPSVFSEHGGSLDRLFRDVGLSIEVLDKFESVIPLKDFLNLLNLAAERCSEPHFGLAVGRRSQLEDWGAFGHRLLFAKELKDALDAVSRSVHSFQQATRVSLRQRGPRRVFSIDLLDAALPDSRQLIEAQLMFFVEFVRRTVRSDWNPVIVYFKNPEPPDLPGLLRALKAPTLFSQPLNGFEIEEELLVAPIHTSNPYMSRLLDDYMRIQATNMPPWQDLKSTVATVIKENLEDSDLRLESVTKRLGLGTRTLQRRLDEIGVRYSDLVDQTRQGLAAGLLKESELPISEIAFRLGYADVSSFNRAFARWTGGSPSRHRRTATTWANGSRMREEAPSRLDEPV